MSARFRPKVTSKPLHGIFTSVPISYDLINRIVTWGLDQRWRRKAAVACLASRPERVLDLCCGTGKLAIVLARMAESPSEIAGIDYSQPMLDLAIRKVGRSGLAGRIALVLGDVADLPFADESFDSIGISFGFRNLTYRNPLAGRYLDEVFRVLKVGGRFVIVETSQPGSAAVRSLFHLYIRFFVYRVGYLISGNKPAYRYMSESIARFYACSEVKEMLLEVGFRRVASRSFFWGAVRLHVALK